VGRALGWAASKVTAGWAAGHITVGRSAGQDVAKFVVEAGCGPSYCGLNCNVQGRLQAQISSPCRALLILLLMSIYAV